MKMEVRLFAEMQFRTSEDSQLDLHRQDLHRVKDLSRDGIKHNAAKCEHYGLPLSADCRINQ